MSKTWDIDTLKKVSLNPRFLPLMCVNISSKEKPSISDLSLIAEGKSNFLFQKFDILVKPWDKRDRNSLKEFRSQELQEFPKGIPLGKVDFFL